MTPGTGKQGHRVPKHVYVGADGLRRLRAAIPVLKDADDQALIKLASREISAAYEAGRVAKTQPRWVVRGDRRAKAHGNRVYVWTFTEDRCYLVQRGTRRSTGDPQIRVVAILNRVEGRTP